MQAQNIIFLTEYLTCTLFYVAGLLVPQQAPAKISTATKCAAETWHLQHQRLDCYSQQRWQHICWLPAVLHRLSLQLPVPHRQLSPSHWGGTGNSAVQASHPHRVPYLVFHWNLQDYLPLPPVLRAGSVSASGAGWVLPASLKRRDGCWYRGRLSEEAVWRIAQKACSHDGQSAVGLQWWDCTNSRMPVHPKSCEEPVWCCAWHTCSEFIGIQEGEL